MTVKEFFSEKNAAKSNPFEGLEVKQKITMDEYKNINDLVSSFIFNDKDEYMPLTKEFAFKFWVMIVYLNLDASELPEVSVAFEYINCTDIYERFISQLDYPAQIDNLKSSINDYVSYCISNNTLFQEVFARAKDIFTTISNEATIGKFIEMISAEILNKEVLKEIDEYGKVKND